MSKAATVVELWFFVRNRKKYWLLPLLAALLLVASLLIASQSPILAPFVYTLF